MEENIKAALASNIFEIVVDNCTYKCCAADDEQSVMQLNNLNNSGTIWLADAIWFLQYHPAPDIDYDEQLAATTPEKPISCDTLLQVSENCIRDDGLFYISIVKEPLVYAILKRMRKPLYSVRISE